MSKKHLISIFCLAVAGCDVFAVGKWPQYAGAIEMATYTIMVFGVPVMHFWPERDRPVYWIMLSSATLVHFLFLYIIRTIFPFRSVWTLAPIALIETTGILALMLKVLGGRSVERPE